MYSLDDLLTGGASVVSQEHNTGNVNYGGEDAIRNAGGRRPSEPWDTREYGISLAEAQARWDNAQTPEARGKVIADLKARALARAGLDTTGGRVAAFFAGKAPWHGLGVVVDRAATSAEAIRFAGLDWSVEKLPLRYVHNGEVFDSPEAFAIVRGDNGAQLGTVGSKYKPVQNAEGFAFLDGVLAEFGAKYETAGSIYGGRRVWILAHLPEQAFEVQAGDAVEPYVLFSNCHDGSGAAWTFPTCVRVECANTQRLAMRGRGRKALSIRHTGDIASKIGSAREALGLAVESVQEYRTVAEKMVATACPVKPEAYFGSILDELVEFSEVEKAMQAGAGLDALLHASETERQLVEKTLERKLERRGELLADMLDRYESERCSPRGTVWAAYNAVTEHADHAGPRRKRGTEDNRASRRFESILTGEADAMKQLAYREAVAMLN